MWAVSMYSYRECTCLWREDRERHTTVSFFAIESAYIEEKIESGEVIPTDGGGWQCNKNCFLLTENMRTSYYGGIKRAQHDRMHNTPGIWSEALTSRDGIKKLFCSKCPGTRESGMIDYVTAPLTKKSTAGASFHAFRATDIKKHVEASGIPRQKHKKSSLMIARRLELTAKGVPFVTPPTQCALYGVTYSSTSKQQQCSRLNCPIVPYEGGVHSWSTFTQFD